MLKPVQSLNFIVRRSTTIGQLHGRFVGRISKLSPLAHVQTLTVSYSTPAQRRRYSNKSPDPFQQLGRKSIFDYGVGPWLGLSIMLAVGITIVIWFWKHKKERHERLSIKMAGSSRIGGTWSLVDHDGRPVNNMSFDGKYRLVYFGFTFCPDVCPIELKKMGEIITALDKEIGPELIQPLFVSLDPWRDSVEQIKNYVAQFHPRILGLTGTPQQCDEMAKKHRVYTTSNKTTDTPDSSSEDYTVDHSIFIYLLDKEGKFVDLFGVDKDAEVVIGRIRDHMIMRKDIPQSLWHKITDFFKIED